MDVMSDFSTKFRVKEMMIFDTYHWAWSLRPHQVTVGAGILSLKRPCPVFSEVTLEEFTDLGRIVPVIESTLQRCFGYDVINYLMLMMFDKQVHYHIFPRYEKPVEVFGRTWRDENWPGLPTLIGEPLPDSQLNGIASLIRSKLKDEGDER